MNREPSSDIKQRIRETRALNARLWQHFRAETCWEAKDTLTEDLCITARWLRKDLKRLARR
jgi:hypothetical protein